MKQNFNLARRWIDSTQVRPFLQIAAMASERQILNIVGAAVLTSDYVLDVMGRRAILLAKLAVLATTAGPVTHKTPDPGIHR